MLDINILKERNNILLDEMRRLEGAIREINHLIALIEKQVKVDSIEKIN